MNNNIIVFFVVITVGAIGLLIGLIYILILAIMVLL